MISGMANPDLCSPAHRGLAAAAIALTVAVGLAGCSTSGSEAAPTTTKVAKPTTTEKQVEQTTTTSEVDDGPTQDPIAGCPDPADVAKIVASPVDQSQAVGSTFGSDVSYRADGCSYDLADDKGSVKVQRLTADGTDSSQLFGKIETAAAKDSDQNGFEQIDDLGDDAYRNGTELVVLDNDQILFLTYTPTGDSDDENPDKALRVATSVLPLKMSAKAIDCDPIGKALVDEFGPVDHTLTGGGVVGVNDVSINTQNCTVVFKDKGEASVAVAPGDQWKAWVAAKKDSGFRAVFNETSVGELAAFDTGEKLFVDDGEKPLVITTEDLKVSEAKAVKIRMAVAELAVGS